MDRLTIFAAALLLMTACTEEPEVIGTDELAVVVESCDAATRSSLSGESGTKFIAGDKIVVYDTDGNSATFKYRTVIAGTAHFIKDVDGGFDPDKFAAAFYPADSVKSYASGVFTASFGAKQVYAEGSFPNGAAPMISTTMSATKDTLKFKNCFSVIRFSIKYNPAPAKPLTVDTIALSSTTAKLYGKFTFSGSATNYVSDGGNTVNLVSCSSSGALGTSEKYFYVVIPGIAPTTSGETMTVKVIPTKDLAFGGTFQASKNPSTNLIPANTILQMNPFVLTPMVTGSLSSYSLADWDASNGKISVGQITLSKSEISVKNGEMKNIQIFGVSDWSKISVHELSGSASFSADKYFDGTKYYVSITGKSTPGTGEAFVNDEVTNSGSYINVTVTN